MALHCDLAIVGAATLAGEALLEQLADSEIDGEVYALEPGAEAGATVTFRGRPLSLVPAEEFDFTRATLALFVGDAALSEAWLPPALDAGCIAIDGSGWAAAEWALAPVVPELNPDSLIDYRERGAVAAAEGALVPLLLAVAPLAEQFPVQRLYYNLSLSAAAQGRATVERLASETAQLLGGRPLTRDQGRVAFNARRVDALLPLQVAAAVRSVLGRAELAIGGQVQQVPVFHGDVSAVTLEAEQPWDLEHVREVLAAQPALTLADAADTAAVSGDPEAAQRVLVQASLPDPADPFTLNLWIVSDSVQRGRAANTLRIAEILLKNYM